MAENYLMKLGCYLGQDFLVNLVEFVLGVFEVDANGPEEGLYIGVLEVLLALLYLV